MPWNFKGTHYIGPVYILVKAVSYSFLQGQHYLDVIFLLFCYRRRNMELKCEHFYKKITYSGAYISRSVSSIKSCSLLKLVHQHKSCVCIRARASSPAENLYWDIFYWRKCITNNWSDFVCKYLLIIGLNEVIQDLNVAQKVFPDFAMLKIFQMQHKAVVLFLLNV